MSHRTIIEINHDYLHHLDGVDFERLKRDLRSGFTSRVIERPSDFYLPGIRILGERHHSETLTLVIV